MAACQSFCLSVAMRPLIWNVQSEQKNISHCPGKTAFIFQTVLCFPGQADRTAFTSTLQLKSRSVAVAAVTGALTFTDLHQQRADHRVDSAHVWHHGYLVTAQIAGPQSLGADPQAHVACIHIHTHTHRRWECLIDSHLSDVVCKGRTASHLITLPVPPSFLGFLSSSCLPPH